MSDDTRLEFSEMLGRRVRMGSWEDQKISTYRKIREAIAEGRWEDASELADYFTDEANVCFSLYRQWVSQLQSFLRSKGVSKEELEEIDRNIRAKLTLPDGSPWNPHRHWDRYKSEQRQLLAHLHRQEADGALDALEVMKETWRQCHDRDVDHIYGLMSAVQDRYRASGIAEMYEQLLMPLFAWRYGKFDIDQHPWDEALETLMLVACESMRGTPRRTGADRRLRAD
ncbi:MAG: hypothetical protein KatS3mg011_1744 [Acidimicrobiia bacterium]|nr:MAG: hypothetical protein KatS3mg011_1744 [Acidimicrobiia bacterium]